MGREHAREVVVITGLGSLQTAVARRLGCDYRLVLADSDQQALGEATDQLSADGFDVQQELVNVSDLDSVTRLAEVVQSLGHFHAVVCAESELLPAKSAEEIIARVVLGAANILDSFGRITKKGSVAVCMAGNAGTLSVLSKKDEKALVRTAARKLAKLEPPASATRDRDAAYAYSQRAIQLLVEAASIDWGTRGGRTVSISPGAVSAAQSEPELVGLSEAVRSVILESPGDFVGSVDDVAEAVAFAISDDASYVTGADLRVDGGAVAAVRHAVSQQPPCCEPRAQAEESSSRESQPAQPAASKDVVVITGSGGMGTAIAHRLGEHYTVVLADYSQEALDHSREQLDGMGYEVHPVLFDVSDQDAVRDLAAKADALGRFRAVVHTAGVSPVQASTEQIAAVDLIGTAYVLEEFGKIARPGSVAVCIASMSAFMTSFAPDIEEKLATAPIPELRELDVLDPAQVSPQAAYPKAKRANMLRAEAAANGWRKRGARAVSIGPGIILTPMGREELVSKTGPIVRAMIAISAARRAGEPEEVAGVVAFLVSEAASFISGADLLMDGGVIAWMNTVRRGGPGVVVRMLWSRLAYRLGG